MNEKAKIRGLPNAPFDLFVVALGLAVLVIPPLWPRLAVGAVALVTVGWRTRRNLAREIDRLDSIVNAIADPVFVKDARFRFTLVNRAFCDFVGRPRGRLVGETTADLMPTAEAFTIAMFEDRLLKTGKSAELESEYVDPAGVRHTVSTCATPFLDRKGSPNIVGVIRDITRRKLAEQALARSEERYALATFGSNDGILDWDIDARKVYLSPRWKAQLGYSEAEVGDSENEVLSRIHPDDRSRALSAQAAHLRGESPQFEVEIRMRHKDGTYRWMMSRGRAIRDASGRAVRMAGSQRDISEMKALENRLRQESSRDSLTGLYNRRHFFELLGPAMSAARRHGYEITVAMLDLDRFKTVNDTRGHAVGDEVLAAFGRAIATELRDPDVAARYGGDEFCIFFPHTAAEDARAVLERIRSRVAGYRFFDKLGLSFSVTTTTGVVEMNEGDKGEASLMKRADEALYRGKRLGRDRVVVGASPVLGPRPVPRLAAAS